MPRKHETLTPTQVSYLKKCVPIRINLISNGKENWLPRTPPPPPVHVNNLTVNELRLSFLIKEKAWRIYMHIVTREIYWNKTPFYIPLSGFVTSDYFLGHYCE